MQGSFSTLSLLLFASILVAQADTSPPRSGYGFAVDLGSEWMKVCVVSPTASSIGSYVDVAINEQSNRKTPTIIGFDSDNDRHIGESALSLFYKTPSKSFPHLKRLGASIGDQQRIEDYLADFQGFNYHISQDEYGVPVIKNVNNQDIPATLLLSMLYSYSSKLASSHVLSSSNINVTITDAVLLVPEYYTSSQRKVVETLASIGGVNVRKILDELTAVAIDYGLRHVNVEGTTQNIILWGGGAYGVSAVLYTLSYSENTLTVTIHTYASNPSIGGIDLDIRIRDHLVSKFDDEFKKKTGGISIASNPRALSKVLRESRDLKEQLSVSPSVLLEVEEIFMNIDWKTSVSKDDYERWVKDLIPQFVDPLVQVVEKAETLGVTVVDSIEVFGGALRVPLILNEASKRTNKVMGRHVDGEEAAVLGAAHYLAQMNGAPGLTKIVIQSNLPVEPSKANAEDLTLSEEQVASLKKLLKEWDDAATRRRAADGAKNELESIINAAQEVVSGPKGDSKLKEELKSAIDSANLFLEDALKTTTAEEFNAVISGLKDKIEQLKKTLPPSKPVKEESSTPSKPRQKYKRPTASASQSKKPSPPPKKPETKKTESKDKKPEASKPTPKKQDKANSKDEL